MSKHIIIYVEIPGDEPTVRFALTIVTLSVSAHREIFSKSYYINPKSDCIYHFPIDLDPNGRPFVSKSIGKW